MLSPNDFFELMDEKSADKTIRFGTIDADYTTGRPKIIFDGAENPSVKNYPYAASYTPAANDRVLIIKNVVVCKII